MPLGSALCDLTTCVRQNPKVTSLLPDFWDCKWNERS
jgi:hypothetical protein